MASQKRRVVSGLLMAGATVAGVAGQAATTTSAGLFETLSRQTNSFLKDTAGGLSICSVLASTVLFSVSANPFVGLAVLGATGLLALYS